MKYASVAIALIVLAALAACSVEFNDDTGISSFAVRVSDGPTGTVSDSQAFPNEPLRFVLQIRALDQAGNFLSSYNGKVAFRIDPVGRLAAGQPSRLEIENGKADDVEVFVEVCHGAVAIWVEDAGGLEQEGSYAAGSSQVLYFADPTIAQVQRTDNFESSGLFGDFVEIRAADRNVVVTNVRRDGFYCQDLDEPEGAYAGMYVYTHNRPDVETGVRLTALRGQVDEFFGFTELGFPDYLTAGSGDEVEPAVITSSRVGGDDAMEQLESSLVRIENVTVCPVNEQYYAYDQWPVSFDGLAGCEDTTGTILIAETQVFDTIDPPALAGEIFTRITGTLRYHYLADPSWMLIPRRAADFE